MPNKFAIFKLINLTWVFVSGGVICRLTTRNCLSGWDSVRQTLMNSALARQFDRLSALPHRHSSPFHAHVCVWVCALCVCVWRCQRKLKTSRAIDDDEFMRKFNYSTINRADSTPTKDRNDEARGRGYWSRDRAGGGERRANNRWKINADWRQMVVNQRTNREQTGAGAGERNYKRDWLRTTAFNEEW